MNTAHTIVTIVAAAWVGFSAYATSTLAPWVVNNLADYGVPSSWWPWLAAAKAAGAVGLLIGLVVPVVGYVATAPGRSARGVGQVPNLWPAWPPRAMDRCGVPC